MVPHRPCNAKNRTLPKNLQFAQGEGGNSLRNGRSSIVVFPLKRHFQKRHSVSRHKAHVGVPPQNPLLLLPRRDMLGAPTFIAGAPSNLMNGSFCLLCKNLKKRSSSRKNHALLHAASFLLPVPGASSSPRDPRARLLLLLRSDAFCLRGWSP